MGFSRFIDRYDNNFFYAERFCHAYAKIHSGYNRINLISCIISCIFALGYMKNIFQALDGEEPQFSAYGQQARKIITYFVANLFMGIIVVFGICLFIIPGIYLALRLQFFTAFIVEEDTGIIESLKRSWEITRGQGMPLFMLMLSMIGSFI